MPPHRENIEEYFEELLFPITSPQTDETHLTNELGSKEAHHHHHRFNSNSNAEVDRGAVEIVYVERDPPRSFPPPIVSQSAKLASQQRNYPQQRGHVIVEPRMYNQPSRDHHTTTRLKIHLDQAKPRHQRKVKKDEIQIETRRNMIQSEMMEQRLRYDSSNTIHPKEIQCQSYSHGKRVPMKQTMISTSTIRKPTRVITTNRKSNQSIASSGCQSYDNESIDSRDSYDARNREVICEQLRILRDIVADIFVQASVAIASCLGTRCRYRVKRY